MAHAARGDDEVDVPVDAEFFRVADAARDGEDPHRAGTDLRRPS